MASRTMLALLVVTLALPLGMADHNAACSTVTDAGALAIGAPEAATIYLGSDGGVWQESNELPGLQAADCSDDDGRGHHAMDARLL